MAFGSPAAFGSASAATSGGALFGGGHGQVSAQVGGLFGVSAQTSAPQALQRAEGTHQAFQCLQAAACSDSVGGAAVAMAAAQTQLAAAGHTWAAPGGIGAQAALDASSSALTALLAQLSAQPGTDEERAAKFGLYESHSETLSTQRTALDVLWSSCKSDFNGAAKEAVERELKGVDCHGNLELWEDKRHWFVYSMAVKANANQRILEATLAAINTRLQLLSSDADCPVCLESLGDAADVTALGCAHRCCSECWTQWSMQCQQTHTTPFCPLCRQEQFVDALFQAPAPAGGGLFGGAVGGGSGLFGGGAPAAAVGMFGGGAPAAVAGGGLFGGGAPARVAGGLGQDAQTLVQVQQRLAQVQQQLMQAEQQLAQAQKQLQQTIPAQQEHRQEATAYLHSGRTYQKGRTRSSVPSIKDGLVNVNEHGEWIVYQNGRWEQGNLRQLHWFTDGAPGDFPPDATWHHVDGDRAMPPREGKRSYGTDEREIVACSCKFELSLSLAHNAAYLSQMLSQSHHYESNSKDHTKILRVLPLFERFFYNTLYQL